MKQRLFSLLLVTVMVVSLFGCGNISQKESAVTQNTEQSTTTQKDTSESVEVPDEPTHINVWVSSSHIAANQSGQDAVIKAMNEYTKEKINVTFDFFAENFTEKLQLELTTTDNIDLMWFPDTNLLTTIINGNGIMDITDILPNYPTLVESIPELVWDSTLFDGKNYFVPVMKEIFAGTSYIVPVTSAEKVKADKGIDITALEIETVRDMGKLTDFLMAVKELEISDMPIVKLHNFSALTTTDPELVAIESMVGLDTASGKIVDLYTTEEYSDFLNVVYEWNQNGLLSQEWAVGNLTSKVMNPYRNSGNYGISTWNTTPDNEINAKTRYGVEVHAIEIGDRILGNTTMMASDWALSAKTDKADACMKFVELLLTDTYLADLYTFGIEGTNFTYNADSSVHLIPESGWKNNIWSGSSVFTCSILESESVNKKESYETDNEAAIASPILGFRFDASSVSAEIAALKNVDSEYIRLMEYGFYNPEEYLPKFLQAREAAGINKVIEEVQKQYDEWVKTK